MYVIEPRHNAFYRVAHCDEEVIVFVCVFIFYFYWWYRYRYSWFEVYPFVDNVGNCGWLVIVAVVVVVALRVPLAGFVE